MKGRKLTDGAVQEIRVLHANGGRPRELAERFSISRHHVYEIVRGVRRPTAPAGGGGDIHIGRPEYIGSGRRISLEKDKLGRQVWYWYRRETQDRFQAGEDLFDGLVPFFERDHGVVRCGWRRPVPGDSATPSGQRGCPQRRWPK
jgi:hypothetical protein